MLLFTKLIATGWQRLTTNSRRLGWLFLLICLAVSGGALVKQKQVASVNGNIVAATGTIEVVFSPHQGATAAIVRALDQAKHTILVEAYSFSSKPIAAALVAAHKRGITIQMLFDRSQISQAYSASDFFARYAIEQRIDISHSIFHNKVILIDDNTVITGSFNFTSAAENHNAENLLILRDNPGLTKLYHQEWLANWQRAIPRAEFAVTNRFTKG